MASILIKQFSKLNLLNSSNKFVGLCLIDKRNLLSQTEKDWIKNKSLELIERSKNEKGPDIKIDPSQPQLYFEKSEELKTADENVKKIFSLEFARRDDFKRYEDNLIKNMVQKLPIEQDSLELQIALHTIRIKRMANNIVQFNGRNKKVKFLLYRAIHRRDRLMLDLFYKDNQRYEWLKNFLNLHDYNLKEKYEYTRQTRYEKYIIQVKEATKEMRQKKLDALKQEFNAQKEIFFKERNEILNKIKQEIIELGFDNLNFPQIPSTNTSNESSPKAST